MGDVDTRDRILLATADLLAESAGEPVSTRAVCAAAGVGAPTLYHHFGDKQGLLDAVVGYGFEQYLAEKRTREPSADPVADLRAGWDNHVGFGLAKPAFYVLMYGGGRRAPVAEEANQILVGMVEEVARAGRLVVPVGLGAEMFGTASVGVTLNLIADQAAGRTPDLTGSTQVREAILAAITTDAPAPAVDTSLAARALAMDAALATPPNSLSPAETTLLREWLNRLAQPAG